MQSIHVLNTTLRRLKHTEPELADALLKWKGHYLKKVERHCAMFQDTDPEDVVQDTLLYILEAYPKYDPTKSALSSFVYRIIHNFFFDCCEKRFTQRNGYESTTEHDEGGKPSKIRTFMQTVKTVSAYVDAAGDDEAYTLWDYVPNTWTPEDDVIEADKIKYIYTHASAAAKQILPLLVATDDAHTEGCRKLHELRMQRRYGLDVEMTVAAQKGCSDLKPVARVSFTGMKLNTSTLMAYSSLSRKDVLLAEADLMRLCAAYMECPERIPEQVEIEPASQPLPIADLEISDQLETDLEMGMCATSLGWFATSSAVALPQYSDMVPTHWVPIIVPPRNMRAPPAEEPREVIYAS